MRSSKTHNFYNSQTAISLVEFLVALTIASIVAALLFPVIVGAKRKSNETVCVANLSQMGKAIELYRQDQGIVASSGYGAEMGLPPIPQSLRPYGFDIAKSKCNGLPIKPSNNHGVYQFMWFMDSKQKQSIFWQRYTAEYQENSVIVNDMNHRSQDEPVFSPLVTHKVIALYLNGRVRVFSKKGDHSKYSWWNE